MIYMPFLLMLLFVGPAIASIAFFRSLSRSWHWALFSLCVLYAASPFLLTWGGLRLAEDFGCTSEAIRFQCPPPFWHGDLISGLFMAHWLAIFVIPSAILGAIGLLFSWILKHQRSRTTEGTSGQPPTAFYRSRRHKVIAGVCSALAQRWHQPLQVIRIVTVVLAIVIPGFIFLYFWGWLAFPIEQRPAQGSASRSQ
jgi:phage shock protein C